MRTRKNAGQRKRWAKYGRKRFKSSFPKLKGAARLSKKRKVLGIGKFKKNRGRRHFHAARRKAMAWGVSRLMGKNPLRIPSLGGLKGAVTKPFSKGNVKTIAGLAIGAAGVVAALRYAPIPAGYGSGYWGLGLTALAAGAVTAVTAALLPAWAGAAAIGGALVTIVRGAITFLPSALGYIVTPLLEWQPTSSAPAPRATAGFRPLPNGQVAGYLAAGRGMMGGSSETFADRASPTANF